MNPKRNETAHWNDRRWVRLFYRSLFLATGFVMIGYGLASFAWGESDTGSGILGYYIGRSGLTAGLAFVLASFEPWKKLQERGAETSVEPFQNVAAVVTVVGVATLLFSSIFAVAGLIAMALGKAGSLGFALTGIGLGTVSFFFLRTAQRLQSSP